MSLSRGYGAAVFTVAVAVATAIACQPSARKGQGSGGTGGGGQGGAGGDNGGGAGGAGAPDAAGDRAVSWDGAGKSCGEMTTPIPFAPQTPDVLIVFDHSGSMQTSFGGGTRLSVEQKIVRDLVMTYQDRIRFGYEEFPMNTAQAACPGGLACCGAPVVVQPGFMNYAAIDMALKPCNGMAVGTCSDGRSNTPTPDALRIVREFYEGFQDGIKERYVLLSTDGEPNCPSSPEACGASESQIQTLLADGVKTIVLGVSEEVSASACLDRLGQAGGAPKPMGPPYYYAGADPTSLKTYLGDILAGIAKPSCIVDLTSLPPDPSKIAVYFDGSEVPWDPTQTNGWDFTDASKKQIRVFGSYCASLEGFQVRTVDIRFGCPPCGGTVGCG